LATGVRRPEAARGLGALLRAHLDVGHPGNSRELDGSTEGQNREPIPWLKAELAQRGAFENGSTEG
jgi:hypothetical protein